MLLSDFKDSFIENDVGRIVLKKKFRSVSDIVHGMTKGETFLGMDTLRRDIGIVTRCCKEKRGHSLEGSIIKMTKKCGK